MLSLFTAVVYNRYGHYINNDVATSVKLRRKKLATAFALLDVHNRGSLSFSNWCQLFVQLRPEYQPCARALFYACSSSRFLQNSFRDKVRLMFHIIDDTASGDIDKREFLKIVSLLHLNIRSQRNDDKAENWLAGMFPKFYTSTAFAYLKAFVTSKYAKILLSLATLC